jgi:chromosome segregation ATPase
LVTLEWGTASQWAGTLAAIVIAVWGALSKRDQKAFDELKASLNKAVDDLRDDDARQFERIDKLESEVTALEVEIKHLPTRDEFHQIDIKVSRIDAKIDARFDAITQKIDTVIQQNERAQDRLAEREDREREMRR